MQNTLKSKKLISLGSRTLLSTTTRNIDCWIKFFVAISNIVMSLDDCFKVTTDTLTNYQEKQRYSREIRKNLRKSDIPKKLAKKKFTRQ